MDYGNIISRAWKINWGNKWLFVLGFLAALGSGGSSGGSGNFNIGSSGGSDFGLPSDFDQITSDFAPFIVAAVCFLILLGLALWLLRLIGEAGMIASVDRIEGGEILTLGDGFRAGISQLKNMVGLSLVLYGPFILVGLLMVGGIFVSVIGAVGSGNGEGFAGLFGVLGLCLIPLVCLMVIAGLVVNFVYPFAQRSIIIQGMGIMDSVRDGWQILRSNFGEIFVMALIFFLIGIVFGLVVLVVALPLALIVIVPIVLSVVQGGAVITAATVILAIIGVITFILLTAAITSIVRTLQSTSFTLAYHQWAGKKPVSAV